MRSIVVTSHTKDTILSLQDRWRLWMNDTPKATYSEFISHVPQLRSSYAVTVVVTEDTLEAVRGRLSMILHNIPGGDGCRVEEFEIEV
jgi:hypothetical protein